MCNCTREYLRPKCKVLYVRRKSSHNGTNPYVNIYYIYTHCQYHIVYNANNSCVHSFVLFRFKDEHTQNVSAVVADSISLTVQDPEFVLDHKYDETALVDSSSGVHETCMPCSAPKVEALPMEEPPTDYLWSDFSEDIPLDSPAQNTPKEHCIPRAFEENFRSVLYCSCESYQKWLTNAVGVIQSNRQLVVKVCATR